jgi:hypothetical protein
LVGMIRSTTFKPLLHSRRFLLNNNSRGRPGMSTLRRNYGGRGHGVSAPPSFYLPSFDLFSDASNPRAGRATNFRRHHFHINPSPQGVHLQILSTSLYQIIQSADSRTYAH